jgi:hypothetical protein
MIKPWESRAKSSSDCDRMTAMLAEIDELRAVLGDLPESQAEMLQEIKKLRAELALKIRKLKELSNANALENMYSVGLEQEYEINELREALDALKNQEPYGFWWEADGTFDIGQEPSMSTKAGPCSGWKITPLFLAPGAQPVKTGRVMVPKEQS